MSTDTITTHVTAAEYLEYERTTSPHRSEWIDGEVREMTGAKRNHNLVSTRLIVALSGLVVDKPFEVYPGDMKIRIPDEGPFYYPDVVVAPRPPEFEDDREDIVLNPVVVIEILSPSTERFDRGRKLDDYRLVPSVRDYVLVSQDRTRIEHYARTDEGWLVVTATEPSDAIELPAIDGRLPVADVYSGVL